MIVCEFCVLFQHNGKCALGLNIPKGMTCASFAPSLARFCSDPKDFMSTNQIIGMAKCFGMKGRELKKVEVMAVREEIARL